MQRDVMTYDILIVGAGPAGLSASIRLKQLAAAAGREIGVCVLEKGAEVGAHIVSGAVIDPIALDELIPDWEAQGAPLKTAVTEDRFLVLSETGAREIPHALLPPLMRNKRAYIASLGEVCRWLAQQAEALGVEIYAGFAAQEMLYDEHGHVVGIIAGVLNVFFRDVGQFVNILLQFWFWFTPIVYSTATLPKSVQPWIKLNPMTPLANAYQGIFVYRQEPDWHAVWPVAVLGACLCLIAFLLFRRRAGEIVDEL